MKKELLIAIILIFLLVLPFSMTRSSKISSDVEDKLQSNVVNVIIITKDNSHSMGLSEEKKIDGINAVSANIAQEDIEKLQDNSNVIKVFENKERHIFLKDSAPLINATKVWPVKISGINITGSNIAVCILDTGVNYSHADLGNCTTSDFLAGNCSKIIAGYDYVNNDADPYDDHGHGTHIAGIIAASGGITGIAPDVKIVAIKVCNSAGSCNDTNILNGISWCINNATKYNITAISLSLGDNVNYTTYCDNDTYLNATYVPLINSAVNANISVVVSTGNSGNYTAMSAPACISNAISVGSTNKSDSISSFSNRNNLTTILAPGSSINSTCYNCSYVVMSGTSMATPHVAGAIALLQQAKFLQTGRYNTISEIKALLRNGKNITDATTGINYTRLDVYSALMAEDSQAPSYFWISKPNLTNGSSVNVILNATDNTGITIYNITINSQQFVMNKTGDNYSYVITPTSIANITYNITFGDALGNLNTTDTVILQINDTTSPYYSNISMQNFTYNSSGIYTFNITWQDTVNVGIVKFALYSPVQTNYTAFSNNTYYFINLTTLAAGNYSFQWLANDTAGNTNQTDMYNFSIAQSDPVLNISLNISGILYYQDVLVENGTNVTIKATSIGEGSIILYLNNSIITQGSNSIFNITQFNESFINNIINITAFYNSTQNYTLSMFSRFITVESTSSPPRSYKISPSNNSYINQNVTFKINATDATLKNATLYIYAWNSTNSSFYMLYTNATSLTGMFNETNWTYNLSEGVYLWDASASDNSNNKNLAANGNYTITVDLTVPTVSSSLSSSSIYTDESSTITCSGSDANFDSLKILVGGVQKNSNSSSTNITYIQPGSIGAGTYNVNCSVYDRAGNTNVEIRFLTVSARPPTSSGSGGGGGPRVITPTTTPTPSITEQTASVSAGGEGMTASFASINAEEAAVMTIPQDSLSESGGIISISIVPSVAVSNIQIEVKKISAENVSVQVSDLNTSVYNYLEISVNLNESSLKNSSISFEIDKSWINSTKSDKNKVKLKRFHENWQDLKTEKVAEDSSKVYYTAESPGFSLFAITAGQSVAVLPVKKSKLLIIIGLIALIAVLIVIIYYTFRPSKY